MRFGLNYNMFVEVVEFLLERYICNILVYLKCILLEMLFYFDVVGF